jgi:hypothetical protein
MTSIASLIKIGGQDAVNITTPEFGREWDRLFIREGLRQFGGVRCIRGVPQSGENDRARKLLYPNQ